MPDTVARSQRRSRSAGSSLPGAGARARRAPPEPTDEPDHQPSPTAVAAEALRTGVLASALQRSRDDLTLPGEAERIKAGDPDDRALGNEYVGDETPGGSTPTPDQGNVDDIGRAYGLEDEDSGELRTSSELMERRDRRRTGLSVRRRSS